MKDESPNINVTFRSTNTDGTPSNLGTGDAFAQRGHIKVIPGLLTNIHINAAIFNNRGAAKLVLENEKDVRNWPGGPTLTWSSDPSNPNNPAVQVLDIAWQVPCKLPKTSNFNLNLQGVNTQVAVNGKLKSNAILRSVEFLAPAAVCSQPAPTSSAAPAPSSQGAAPITPASKPAGKSLAPKQSGGTADAKTAAAKTDAQEKAAVQPSKTKPVRHVPPRTTHQPIKKTSPAPANPAPANPAPGSPPASAPAPGSISPQGTQSAAPTNSNPTGGQQ
jgi:hypothetical protein